MKVFEIKRFAVHDGPGIRTTIFFKGCPLSCIWCHNPEGISGKTEIALLENKCVSCGECFEQCSNHFNNDNGKHEINRENCTLCLKCINSCLTGALLLYGREYLAEELFKIVKQDIDFYNESSGGVTCSGGEPLMHADFIASFFELCKIEKINTAIDTSGYALWNNFEKLIPFTDLFLFDLKHMNPVEHKKLTGVDNTLILENLKLLSGSGANIEIRIPVIPGLNDNEENLKQTSHFLKNVKVNRIVVLPYHPLSGSKYSSLGKTHNMPAATGKENLIAAEFGSYLQSEGLPCVVG